MKNKIYYLGMIACGLLMIASIFKVMHWSGANVLIFISITLLCLLFLPAAIVSCYKVEGRKKKAVYITVFLSLFGIFTSALFKIMHWPGTNYLFFVGMLLPVLLFFPVYLYSYNKEKDESIQNFLYIIFFLVYLSGMGTILAIKPSHTTLSDAIKLCQASDLSGFYHFSEESDQKSQKLPVINIQTRANSLLNTIEDMKTELIAKSSKKNRKAINCQNQILLWKISNLEDQEVARTEAYRNKMIQLIREVESFQNFLSTIPGMEDNKSTGITKDLLPVEFKNYRNGQDQTDYVYDTHLIMTILQLTEMENNIRLAASEALSEINSQKEI